MDHEPKLILDKLLNGCLKNDRISQRNLYELFYGYGLSISMRYADNRNEAVELLNEAFMKIFKNLKKFDLRKPFKPWLRRIIINTCINNFRKKKIEFKADLEEAADHATSEEILTGIAYEEILDLIRKLSPAYRAVFNLYVIEGYKHEEISKMLEISIGASKSNLSRAKKQMRLILNEYFQEDYERTQER